MFATSTGVKSKYINRSNFFTHVWKSIVGCLSRAGAAFSLMHFQRIAQFLIVTIDPFTLKFFKCKFWSCSTFTSNNNTKEYYIWMKKFEMFFRIRRWICDCLFSWTILNCWFMIKGLTDKPWLFSKWNLLARAHETTFDFEKGTLVSIEIIFWRFRTGCSTSTSDSLSVGISSIKGGSFSNGFWGYFSDSSRRCEEVVVVVVVVWVEVVVVVVVVFSVVVNWLFFHFKRLNYKIILILIWNAEQRLSFNSSW